MRKLVLLASLAVVLVLFAGVGHAQAKQASAGDMAPPAQAVTGTKSLTATLQIPYVNDWLSSAHADVTAEAFNHWNSADPPEIPTTCAKCHSTAGYQDYLGADGSAPNVVDHPAAIGSVISCVACHNDKTLTKDSVVMPSGITLTVLGPRRVVSSATRAANPRSVLMPLLLRPM